MSEAVSVIQPDLSSRPLQMTCEKTIAAPPHVVFAAWTTDKISSWFAASGTVLMKPQVDVPYFFETRFEGQRHPHYGRFLKLETDRLVELTWITALGTQGVETVVTVELERSGEKTRLRLTHAGFPDEASRDGHADAWPGALDLLDAACRATS